MARLAARMAENPRFGYSQKPPSGRWGPDFDCSSFLYFVANAVGYRVGIGGERTRFTGVMLEDFKEAGFQLLPFANVGLGELEVGDILLNLALHAEVYVGEGQMVGAQASETGGFVGRAGDQTGTEIEKHPAYVYEKGWDYVLRPPSEEKEEELGYVDVDAEEPESEGEEDMAYPYSNYTGQMNGSWMPRNGMGSNTWMPPMNYGNMGGGYPQGNLGQMNGYSQAGNGGYPQGGQSQGYQQNYNQSMPSWPQGQQGSSQRHLTHVKDLNEVRDIHVGPGEAIAVFIGEGQYMAIKSADQEGFPSIRVFEMKECSEEMPQHNWMPSMIGGSNSEGYSGQQMPQMQQSQGGGVSREEFDQLKEMIGNVQSAISGFPQGVQSNGGSNGTSGDAGAKQGNQSSSRNSRNS